MPRTRTDYRTTSSGTSGSSRGNRVASTPAGTADGDEVAEHATASGAELLALVVGLSAAVYLAAGIALLSDVTAGLFSWADSATVVGFAGLAAGLFIRRAYVAPGDVADRFLESSDPDAGDDSDGDTGETARTDAPRRDAAPAGGRGRHGGGDPSRRAGGGGPCFSSSSAWWPP